MVGVNPEIIPIHLEKFLVYISWSFSELDASILITLEVNKGTCRVGLMPGTFYSEQTCKPGSIENPSQPPPLSQ